VWTATELGRTYLFTGFPWVLLGYSQTSVLPIAQVASLVGVYGLSLLVAAVSATVAYAAADASRGASPARAMSRAAGPAALVLVLLIGLAAWGSRRVAAGELTRTGTPTRVGLVQGNVDQNEKIARTGGDRIFQDYIDKTRQAIGAGAEFILWPESSTPFRFEEDHADADRVRAIARQARVSILLGSEELDHTGTRQYYNSAFMVGRGGETVGVYRKMHLVPFGEYVPLQKVLFFAAPLVQAVSDFSAGDRAVLLPAAGGHVVNTSICYEVVYPDLVRTFVAGGSELLTTITNDAWFGATSAPIQHFEQASMRAIENGRYLVRAANTGISGIVDPYGRVVVQTQIFQPAVVVGQARFVRDRTVYGRIGDVLAYASAVCTLGALLFARRRVR
jgi:apolipoprotein N-acyltransferase